MRERESARASEREKERDSKKERTRARAREREREIVDFGVARNCNQVVRSRESKTSRSFQGYVAHKKHPPPRTLQ